MSSQRRPTLPPKIVLTRERLMFGLCAGQSEDRRLWRGIDAIRSDLTCARCGDRFQYGYAPIGSMTNVHCVSCVEFRDAEQEG